MQGHSVQTTVGSKVDAEADVDSEFLPVRNFCGPGFGNTAQPATFSPYMISSEQMDLEDAAFRKGKFKQHCKRTEKE
jgi:hypothetical protein